MQPAFQDFSISEQFPHHKHFFWSSSSLSSPPACPVALRALDNLVPEKSLVFYFLFSQFPTIIPTIFFREFVFYLTISEVRLHFQCYKP